MQCKVVYDLYDFNMREIHHHRAEYGGKKKVTKGKLGKS